MQTPSHDLIVDGATSFVGQIITRYLAEHFGTQGRLKWAIAGRSEEKLAALRSSLGLAAGKLPIVLADAADEAALRRMCTGTRVVLSTVAVPAPDTGWTGDGFETGSYSEWTSSTTAGTGSTLAVNTTTVYEGTYSSKSFTTNDEARSYFWIDLDDQELSDVYIRWYTYITSLDLTSGQNLYIVGTGDVADGEILNVQIDDPSEYLELHSDISTTSAFDTEAFPFNEWVCLELRIHLDNTSGNFELYKNGSKVAEITGEDTRNLSDYLGHFDLGITYVDDITADTNVYIDDVVLSDSYMGCNLSTTYHRGPMRRWAWYRPGGSTSTPTTRCSPAPRRWRWTGTS